MRWRVVKRMPLNEVRERVAAYVAKYSNQYPELSREFESGKMSRDRLDDYIEWSSMIHALRAAGEGEDFDYYAEEDLELTPEKFDSLTSKRIELLDYLADEHAPSINALADSVGRDVKNVYNDLRILEGLGFIRLVKEGKSLVPELLVQEVTILLG